VVARNQVNAQSDLHQIKVVPATLEQIPCLIDCHLHAFQEAFSTLLGPRYLEGAYRSFIECRRGICLVAIVEASGRPVGVVAGNRGCIVNLRLVCTMSFLGLSLLSRAVWDRQIRSRLMGGDLPRHADKELPNVRDTSDRVYPEKGSCQLRWLAVDPRFQRLGIGRKLLHAFGVECSRRSYRAMHLTTNADNTPAIRLYTKSGWKRIGSRRRRVFFRCEVSPST